MNCYTLGPRIEVPVFNTFFTMESLENVKENLQPLKGGRKVDSLRAAVMGTQLDEDTREETRKYVSNLSKIKL